MRGEPTHMPADVVGATGGAVRSSPAVSDAFVYVGSDDHALHAYGIPPISFSKSRLQGVSVSPPTVGAIRSRRAPVRGAAKRPDPCSTISRTGNNAYRVTNSEVIDLIRTIPNHDDDGALNTGVTTRLIIGLAVGGTASSPALYVASSDPRVGGGRTALSRTSTRTRASSRA